MSDWISVRERLPVQAGELSGPVWVAACEFGQPWVFAVARCFISVEKPDEPSWYLDQDFYGIDVFIQVGSEVHYWQDLPLPPEPLSLQFRLAL